MIINARKVSEVGDRIVAIVRFGPPTEMDGLKPGEFFQVTIDPFKFSPDQTYIRFGTYPGDEIMGWQRADCMYVVSELVKYPGGMEADQLKLTWAQSPALETLQ
jgi:hypothetical protein